LRWPALTAVAAVVMSAGLVVGLSTGAASAGHANTATTGTTATVPEPVVTTVVTPVAKHLPGTGKPFVHLGDMNTPDQFIIGQLYQLALQQEGYTVILNRNISAPSLRVAGLKSHKLDLYPEYLGEWNSWIAHLHRRFPSLRASYAAGATYARKHGFELLQPTPYSYTSCVAVVAPYAHANHNK
jgi:glycine betaine/choline ABC-type transport system substrate-binding protein